MGATEVYFTVSDTVDPVKAFEARRDEDLYMYGADPYSGTFGAIGNIAVRENVFATFELALNYCLSEAYKRGPAIAVQFVADEPQPGVDVVARLREGKKRWLIAGLAPE